MRFFLPSHRFALDLTQGKNDQLRDHLIALQQHTRTHRRISSRNLSVAVLSVCSATCDNDLLHRYACIENEHKHTDDISRFSVLFSPSNYKSAINRNTLYKQTFSCTCRLMVFSSSSSFCCGRCCRHTIAMYGISTNSHKCQNIDNTNDQN